MALITLSLGSNIAPTQHIRLCLDALTETFGPLQVSRIFESEPVGFKDKRNFYNLVVAFQCDWSPGEIQAWAKHLETQHGRRPNTPKYSPRALDIDLLTVGDLQGVVDGILLPRAEVTRNAFVLQPLAELLPDHVHPTSQTSYADLWAQFTLGDQRLWAVDFTWQGQLISQADMPLAFAMAR